MCPNIFIDIRKKNSSVTLCRDWGIISRKAWASQRMRLRKINVLMNIGLEGRRPKTEQGERTITQISFLKHTAQTF